MPKLALDSTNALCAALFVAAGLFFGIQSLGLEIGTAFRMGPGYFPLCFPAFSSSSALSSWFKLFASKVSRSVQSLGAACFFILVAPIFFGLTVRGLGFVPSIFLTALIASFASSRMTLAMALILSALLAVFATLVFSYALGLPFQRFGPWLPF